MAGRKVSGRDEAVALLAEADRIGQPLAACARAAGIDGRSLRMWRTNLSRGSRSSPSRPTTRLVELVTSRASESRYRIVCGDFAVEVDSTFESAVLRRLLEVVASC
jgi:transposase-like protein